MGKSAKKSATKVDVAPVAVTQSGKKGKRGADNEIEKALSAKKQKVERNETVIANQKAEKKIVKKAPSSSSEEDSDSDSDSESEVAVKNTAPAKNGSAVAKKPKAESSSESSSDSDDSEDEKPAAKKGPTAVKNGSVVAKKTPASDSSDSSDDESDDEKPAPAVNNGASKKPASSSDDSEDDSDSSEEEEPKKVAAQPKKDQKKPAESSDSDDDSSDEDDVAKAAPVAAAKGKVDSESSDEEEDSSDSDDEPKAAKLKVQAATKSDSSEDDSSDEEEEESLKTPTKKDTDVEMVDAQKSAASTFQKTPKTPATSEATGSKTLFAGNLSFNIEEDNIREFFKEAGEVIDVRFAVDPEGQFKGFGHVEFATPEAAQKALAMRQQDLLGRPVRLDLAHERGASQSRENNSSFQKGGRAQGSTAFIRGFDTSLEEHDIRSALEQHFGSCGESTRISIPPDYENGGVKGMAYIDFVDSKGLNAALELDGSDIGGGYVLNVQEAKPRGDSGGGRGGRDGGRGGRFSGGRGGRDGGRGGRFSGGRGGRDSGGRGGRFSGGRGGRDGGRGGRTPYRSSVPSGKKTTFGDD